MNSGCITLGGQDISDMRIEALNEQISFVSQEQFLFNTSLFENIRIGRPEASREEVLRAASLAQCDEFLERFPRGIDSKAGDGGKMLSGGERQRISIARCILKDAPIVILDEATASVDADNESHIQAAISELVKGKTLLVIAHRLNTIESADQILVIEDGEIKERGTHKDLMAFKGLYHSMVTKRSEIRGFDH